MRQKRASASGDGDGADDGADEPNKKQPTAIERARMARNRRKGGGGGEQENDDASSQASGGGGEDGGSGKRSRRRRASEGDGDEAASEGGGTSPASDRRRGSIRDRLGMKPLSVKTGRPDGSSPGATPEPLGESNMPAPRAPASETSDTSDATGSKLSRPSMRIGGLIKATTFARRLASKLSGRRDEDELPPWEGQAELFEDGAAAVRQLSEQLASVTVHRTDELPHDWRIAHPLCSVSVINGYNGRLLRKSNSANDAVTPNERRGPGEAPLEQILPIMTKPYVLRGATARLPSWEEELLFQESFTHLLHPRVFLFFELLDFLPDAPDAGLKPFAWGFLKMVSGPMDYPGHANVLRPMPLRLQLFRWLPGVRASYGQPAVWAQYLAAGRKMYSSTLYATIRPMPVPERVSVKFPHRPMAVHHVEEGRIPYERLVQETARDRSIGAASMGNLASVDGGQQAAEAGAAGDGSAPWQAMTMRGAAPCQLPNNLLHALAAGARGATAIALSPDGGLVAIALAEEGYAMLAICDVFSGRRRETMHAHRKTIHELCWLSDGERVCSVSADGTAKIWRARRRGEAKEEEDEDASDSALATLPHPSYVYCVRAQPKPVLSAPRGVGSAAATAQSSLLVTGANDHSLRLWDVSGDKAELLVTKTEHRSRINTVAWPMEATIFSADGAGVIKTWEVAAGAMGGGGADLNNVASIEKKELRDVPINSVTPHPTRRTRLLVQTRKSQLMCLDHRMQHFSTRYVGHRCESYHVRAAYSPDGRFVVAGSEDGCFYAWSEETGDLLIDGMTVGFSGPLLQISWSSQQHVMALCGYGPDNPALIYYFDKDVAAENPSLAAAVAATISSSTAQPGALGGPADGALAGALGTATRTAVDAAARAEKRQGRAAARADRRGNLSAALNAAADGGGAGADASADAGGGGAASRRAQRAAANAAAANAAATPDRKAMAAQARAQQNAAASASSS